ncbi:hypothetical protein MLOOGBEN_00340 [Bacillus sp. EB106-08-02-XG196]|uniref:hypothetical protein n=1 Tax=Bacillus sp. EB106-08-02-XG196 TaxID=2737049 RepID=UPI0015C421CF|nr:hypothetical protein [Bacillus sp. EB106-08-02-XG196]NWQ39143.1 hypothetical protein [Bacillus sp. EB106-08-02-XG196]
MEVINTKIGDHFIQIICKSKVLLKMLQKNFQTNICFKQPDLVIEINDGYGVSFIDYQVKITKGNNQIQYCRADYLIEINSDYKSATISVFNELALKHALMNLYSAFIVYHNWGLLIHSSCVMENGKAHIFSGHSGAGKSTAAKLSFPRMLLSDEATIVKINSGNVEVYNSPFRSELEAEPFEGTVTLESIQIIYQALQNDRTKLPMADALINLMDKVFFWPHSQDEIKTILNLLTKLVKNVSVYDLNFQKNNTFWKLIS